MPNQLVILDDEALAEIEAQAKGYYCNKCSWFGTDGPSHPNCNYSASPSPSDATIAALCQTVRALRNKNDELRQHVKDDLNHDLEAKRERFGYVVFTGCHKILDYDKSDGQQMATADDADSAKLIVRALNAYEADKEALRKAAICSTQS